ncbi:MAG: PKD domain-containing protein, partial [Methanoregula sp.]
MNPQHRETGVSEVLGAIILVSVITLGIAIAGVAILSSPQKQTIPAVSSEVLPLDNQLLVSHNGGDNIPKSEMAIMVDGVDKTTAFTLLNGDPWSSWTVGDTLVYQVPSGQQFPRGVQIIYLNGQNSYLIQSWGEPVGPDTTVTATASPTATTTTVTTSITTSTSTPVTTTPTPVPLFVLFNATPTTGYVPLSVQFTDQSTGPVTAWHWSFGDGNTSSVQNPVHNYTAIGNYTVSLTATSASGSSTLTKTDYIQVTEVPFVTYVIENNVFVYGNQLSFSGDHVTGPYATVILTESLITSDLNGGTSIAVHTLYVDGDVYLDQGSAGLGSSANPGNIYVNGDMTLLNGQRDVYGDVYVNGSFVLKDARIHGTVYTDGDVTLGNTPTLDAESFIYYTGTLTIPDNYNHPEIVAKCIHADTVPGFTMPTQEIPSAKSASWYAARGYVSSGALADNLKIFANSYTSSSWTNSVSDVVIIASTGDISITGLGGSGVRGVLFA